MQTRRTTPTAPRARLVGRAALGLTLALTTAGVAGCTAQEPVTTPASAEQVEVFTWWASGSEKLAFDSLVEVFVEQNPGTVFVDGGIAGGAGSTAKTLLASRLADGDPPDTFQVHGGAELADYVADGRLRDLDDLVVDLGLDRTLPASVRDMVSVDGTVYAIPSNVHRANVLWANPDVLAAAGLEATASFATLDDWFVALDAVRATGRTPLALGSTWTQVHLLEQVLLAHLGPQGYAGLWDGTTDVAGAEVTAALADFERLLGYTNADRDSMDWQDATQDVIDGDAAFVVMGDWALEAFEEAGDTAPTEVLWATAPGTDGVFDVVVDAFALPAGAPNPDAATRWLRAVASADGQTAFSNAKGAIPARSDLGTAQLGTYQRAATTAFRADTVVPSLTHGAAVSTGALDAVTAAVGRFTSGATTATTLQAELALALR